MADESRRPPTVHGIPNFVGSMYRTPRLVLGVGDDNKIDMWTRDGMSSSEVAALLHELARDFETDIMTTVLDHAYVQQQEEDSDMFRWNCKAHDGYRFGRWSNFDVAKSGAHTHDKEFHRAD